MRFGNFTLKLVLPAMIGALYVVLTMLVYPLAFSGAQVRVSEALTVLPAIYPPAVWGLFVGCAISNIPSPLGIIDVIFGSLATLSAALITARIKNRWLVPLPSVIINALVIGLVITISEGAGLAVFFVTAGQVGLGQMISCYGLGLPLLYVVKKYRLFDRITAGSSLKDGERNG